MDNKTVLIVIGIIGLSLFLGYIADLMNHPEITLKDSLVGYDGTNTPGNSITNTPTGQTSTLGSIFGFVLDIPILGSILSFVSWIITELISMISNVASLPGIFPSWMSHIFAIGFVAFIVFIYIMLMPSK